MSIPVSDDCINRDSYGMICVHCNACGRIDKNTMWEARYKMYYGFLEGEISKHNDDSYKSDLQQANIASNIIHLGQKIAECVEHINFGGLQPFKLERSDTE